MGVVNKWTTEETRMLLELINDGLYYHEIAARIGRSECGIEAKARQLGVQRMPKRIPKTTGALCWGCAKAVNSGCSWSRRFAPVPGWTAKYSPLKVGEGRVADSFIVLDCPEFVEG